ncbi:hypothetical protein BJ508DRAFT_325569 [Ascobolus immersus RN42]|uniref:DUF7918 domain-containing protein n=1 Tax=Ascobolus immersus RN42 TaxID=1160509 RepID=A0A3N4IDT5_ASCIM|nr:hypothetical protein BJ508DRAFT_325569 [Ascobolus immersus RN42]
MVTYEGFTFSIRTPTALLREYPYPDDEPPDTHTVYLEVPPENEPQTVVVEITSVDANNTTTDFGLAAKLWVDGLPSELWKPLKKDGTRTIEGLFVRPRKGAEPVLQEVSFAPLKKTEDAHEYDESLDDLTKNIGVIEIVLRKYTNDRGSRRTTAGSTVAQTPDQAVFHEKQLKGSSTTHTVKLGKEKSTDNGRPEWRKGVSKASYHKKVRFLYRSRASLQSLGVISYTPTPPASSAPVETAPIPDPTPEAQIQREAGRIHRASSPPATRPIKQEATLRIKQEPRESPPPASRRIKRGRSESPSELEAQIKQLESDFNARIKELKERAKRLRDGKDVKEEKVDIKEEKVDIKVEGMTRVKKEKKRR